MLADVGYYSLVAAAVLCLYSVLASLIGAKKRRADFVESGERAVIGMLFLVVFASGILIHALITSNFHIEYVAHYSSTTLPALYQITAFWGGQAGSLLFWLLVLTIYTVIAV